MSNFPAPTNPATNANSGKRSHVPVKRSQGRFGDKPTGKKSVSENRSAEKPASEQPAGVDAKGVRKKRKAASNLTTLFTRRRWRSGCKRIWC